ncbi:hypothetical protein SAMD00019534_095790 [Acytostelium subglobosum LB1]|uniref:hypothetical protein n=1 Tax=Acytostelium subglobosum LB1 TaxID=1410327 RepID=UPI0006448CBE|nr:hypothetical protein SAMD00019534_095790 [Acytostelium subglobosum LB1]GAM26404.1 hypothetical protein SAMD00019534_095790 [Acytostelium subglobosum LB1]|eukprot:XP_012750500.1 hypothetical protein SAMD00019534_095790 [Acytostelium subglobosum LB1]
MSSTTFNSRFISEKEIEEQGGAPKKDVEYDPRSLYERLQEQKAKRDDEWNEKHKDKASEGLNEDDIQYYQEREHEEIEAKRREQEEIDRELRLFKREQATLVIKTVGNGSGGVSGSIVDQLPITTLIDEPPVLLAEPKKRLVNVKLIPTTTLATKQQQNNNKRTTTEDNDQKDDDSNKKPKTVPVVASLFAYDSDDEDEQDGDEESKEENGKD